MLPPVFPSQQVVVKMAEGRIALKDLTVKTLWSNLPMGHVASFLPLSMDGNKWLSTMDFGPNNNLRKFMVSTNKGIYWMELKVKGIPLKSNLVISP